MHIKGVQNRMNSQKTKVLVIADSDVEPLKNYIANYEEISVDIAPFDQVIPTLLSQNLQEYKLVVVLSQLEKVSPEFAELVESNQTSSEQIFSEVREFTEILRSAATKTEWLIVYNWVLPRWGIFNYLTGWTNSGVNRILNLANETLAKELENVRNISVIDHSQMLIDVNNRIFDPKLWAMGKMLYSSYSFEELAGQIVSFVRAVTGRSRKLIAVDLDNTLWGGLVGDIGWENLKLGGTDAIGESFVLFQKQLKSLKNRGILLALVSQNYEDIALEAIDKHPAMVLKRDDFVTWRINLNSKADNICEIVDELNLDLQSVVFIDDTPHQRSLVKETLPEVFVPDWPEDPVLYPYAMKKLYCFEQFQLTDEDKKRTEMTKSNRKRRSSLTRGISREEWLKRLNVNIRIEKINKENIVRAAQLLNRTNQFNLTTRRMSEESFMQWLDEARDVRRAYAISASDKFGEYGLIGVISFEIEDTAIRICDFLVSCRAVGRGIEDAIIAFAAQQAAESNKEKIIAEFIPTAKNRPMREFLEKIADDVSDGIFTFIPQNHKYPEHIKREIIDG